MTLEEKRKNWEAKFGGGRVIQWSNYEEIVFDRWVDSRSKSFFDKNGGRWGSYCDDEDNVKSWQVVSEPETETEPETEIQIRTIRDFPLVEVSAEGKIWIKRRYVVSIDGYYYCFTQEDNKIWAHKHMRPIKKQDVNELKRNAYLGVGCE